MRRAGLGRVSGASGGGRDSAGKVTPPAPPPSTPRNHRRHHLTSFINRRRLLRRRVRDTALRPPLASSLRGGVIYPIDAFVIAASLEKKRASRSDSTESASPSPINHQHLRLSSPPSCPKPMIRMTAAPAVPLPHVPTPQPSP